MKAETAGKARFTGEIFFDAECAFCLATRRRWGPVFERRGFRWVPLQTSGTAERLGISEQHLQQTMWLRFANGRKAAGAEAWSLLLRQIWWLWPLGWFMNLPGIRKIARAGYLWIARHRECLSGACRLHSQA